MLDRKAETGLGAGRMASSKAGLPTEDRQELAAAGAGTSSAPGAATVPATPATFEKVTMESTSDTEFQLAVEVLYHGSRQAFLSGAHRWMMFFAIVFGAAVAVPVGGDKLCGLLAAAAAAADISFDFVGRSQAHGEIRRRYLELVAQFADEGSDSGFAAAWMKISADEPPTYRWAQLIAYRNACLSLGRNVPDRLPFWQVLGAHLWRG